MKEYIFTPSDLTANSAGSLDAYSNYSLNGKITSVVLQTNNYTTTGSLLVFKSGLSNSGTGLGELIIALRAGSSNTEFFPYAYGATNQAGTGSPQPFFHHTIHGPIRIALSGCGAGTSGALIIKYY